MYVKMLPVKQSFQKCLKYICQTKPYRMLKEWTYEIESEPFTEEQEIIRTSKEDDLENLTSDVVFDLSQEFQPQKKKKLSRSQRNSRRKDALEAPQTQTPAKESPSILADTQGSDACRTFVQVRISYITFSISITLLSFSYNINLGDAE